MEVNSIRLLQDKLINLKNIAVGHEDRIDFHPNFKYLLYFLESQDLVMRVILNVNKSMIRVGLVILQFLTSMNEH